MNVDTVEIFTDDRASSSSSTIQLAENVKLREEALASWLLLRKSNRKSRGPCEGNPYKWREDVEATLYTRIYALDIYSDRWNK